MNKQDGPRTHLFAWDGLAWRVPDNWNLSWYSFAKHAWRVEMEDDYSVRLEAEWTRCKGQLDIQKIQRRYRHKTHKLVKAARTTQELKDLPAGWAGFLYTMPNGARLLSAFVLGGKSKTFCFFRIHFEPEDREQPVKILKMISDTFEVRQGGPIQWSAYDFSLKLPTDFRLLTTSLQAGRKLLVFQFRMCRFYVWFFSLAQMVLKNHDLQAWAADFLNSFNDIRGPVFSVGSDGRITAQRQRRYRLGHYDEIGRWCFRYDVECVHNQAGDQIVLWVHNYRGVEQGARLRQMLKAQQLA